ncbi:MAG TPA: TetR family transcriptional regulator [Bryobacteraceae bacterium]|jgi:AcrR family transcriptional regulator|nr:TetR family transcriptional regulator [Bryobacteraceae bacterium]
MKAQVTKGKAKSDATRGRILEAALQLFRDRGFGATTMREIAESAGVATGAAYYYFDSKDAIVLAFYDQAQQDMTARLEELLAGSRNLAERLRGILQVKLDYFEPSRRFLGALSVHTDPNHPLSPFSAQTREIRENDMRFFERAVDSSHVRVPDDLRTYLPRLLWMYQMGMILFWIYDRSAGQKKTQALIDKSLEVVVRLIKLASLPLTRPLRRMVIDLVDTVTEG